MPNKTEEIIDNIRNAILSHRLMPGIQLREMSLARLYGVSRTVVRQALLRLGKDGLVDLTRGKIAAVAQPTSKEAREVFDLRIALESHVVRTLIARAVPDDITQLREHLKQERAALATGDSDSMRALGADFHALMARLANNSLLAQALEQLQGRIALILQLYQHDYDRNTCCLQDDHERLIQLLEARKTDEALALLHAHLATLESLNIEESEKSDDLQLQRALGVGSPLHNTSIACTPLHGQVPKRKPNT